MPTFAYDGRATHVPLRGQDMIEVSQPWTKSTTIRFNFSIWRACVPNAPYPDAKLHVLWKAAKVGPYRLAAPCPEFGVKTKKYHEGCDRIFKEWKALKVAATRLSALGEAARTIVKGREDAQAVKKKDIMEGGQGCWDSCAQAQARGCGREVRLV